ncbi:pyridoxal-dependent decarboxylase, exosortase A system-associated [Sphingoaurantiacus capsulatus]|uniref:Pyridoxal-dependent decarboxylase, exosortase A system-associated n=1 Tax=Sphingoaurantiacus capsulatus TaxID=1771310 RepID=A0ABV7XF02_9SPHN
MHIPPGFSSLNGELAIAGKPVSAWVEQAGDTPLFVYDRGLIAKRIADLRAALPAGVDIHYAVKANPMPALVGWMAGQVNGLDVASAGELRIALAAGADPARISFAGPGKRDRELEAAIEAGILLNLESAGELERAAGIASRLGKPLRVAVRVNPDFELKGSGMRMGGGAKPFGVDAERVPALLARIDALGAIFEGFHVFAGSQNLSAEALIEAQAKTLDLVARLSEGAPVRPRHVNIGGGFGIPYFPTDMPLDIFTVGKALGEKLAARPAVLADTKFNVELGRYLVGEAGVYLTRVVDVKISHGETFVIVDGGLHHQLAASGNFGTVIRRNYPVANASRFDALPGEPVNVVGCLCTPLDRLAEKAALPVTQVGDLVAVFMAGAYGLTASPTAFLGHEPPGEMLVG